jgi:vacuolar protein sorting-associated protein 13A/C
MFQLRAEALNALDLPISVKAGFLGSITLKVPWSRLGQEPVIVLLDRIFLIAEPYSGA